MRVSQQSFLAQFKKVTDDMYETAVRKNSDYTGDNSDAFKNFTAVEIATGGEVTTEMGFFTRMTDKMSRFAGFLRNGTLKVQDEKIEDTILDLAIYCILLVIYRRSKRIRDYSISKEQAGLDMGGGSITSRDSKDYSISKGKTGLDMGGWSITSRDSKDLH